MLKVEHLSMVYPDGTVALRDVSFEVKEGEFLGIIGLSGSGKSTLLRCINRLLEPSEGKIIWNGRDITHIDQAELRMVRREIGMVFQQFNLVKRSSVMINVLAGRLGYTPPSWSLINRFSRADRALAVAALERVGIPDKGNNRADELSGGQQQRVGIARALMQEPKMILADEPVASLDPVLSHSILGYLEKLNKEDNITVLCSLHFLDLVQRYSTRVIGLRSGKLVFEGGKKDIAEISDSRFKEIYGEEAQRLGVE
jgi:phosphonate transport system ATP-binding protein